MDREQDPPSNFPKFSADCFKKHNADCLKMHEIGLTPDEDVVDGYDGSAYITLTKHPMDNDPDGCQLFMTISGSDGQQNTVVFNKYCNWFGEPYSVNTDPESNNSHIVIWQLGSKRKNEGLN